MACWSPRLLFPTALLALAPALPVRAVILPAGGSPERDRLLQARSRQAALETPGAVGLMLAGQAGPGGGSGLFLGYDADQRTGYVLTAAHLFLVEDKQTSEEAARKVLVLFGPRLCWQPEVKDGIRVQARRLAICPGYRGLAGGWRNDLALVEFDAPPVREALAKAGVRPGTLFAGSLPDRALDARIVGYGLFATQDSPDYLGTGEAHAGMTRVLPVTIGGHRTLRHYSPLLDQGPAAGAAAETKEGGAAPGPKGNRHRFALVRAPFDFQDPFSGATLRVQSHPHQCLTAKGDSGGPLLVPVKGRGHQVAGVASHQRSFALDLGDRTTTWTCQVWEPVQAHLAWIRQVMAGDHAGTLVLTPGQSPLDPDPPAAADPAAARSGTQAETKAETKAETQAEARTETRTARSGEEDRPLPRDPLQADAAPAGGPGAAESPA